MKASLHAWRHAVRNRDPRFDGMFYFGVKTTGIYCRPVCPAKPKIKNIEFFKTVEYAVKAGYRACLRCRPDARPGSPAWVGKSAIVRRALKKLRMSAQRDTVESAARAQSEEMFAVQFGVSARHLRRLFVEETGKTPRQHKEAIRLARAKRLLDGSVSRCSSVTDIAYASGFRSIRRFNDAFKKHFGQAPSQIRKRKAKS